MRQFRVKAFLFINADGSREAEEIAAEIVGASRSKADRGVVAQAVVCEGSAKLVVDTESNARRI